MECCKRRYPILVDLREVKEIRPGKRSKDFDRFPDDARSYDQKLCFVVLYGQEFKLKTLSLVGKGVRDYLNTDKLKSFLFSCSVSTFHMCFSQQTHNKNMKRGLQVSIISFKTLKAQLFLCKLKGTTCIG